MQILSDGLTSFWQGIYAGIEANDAEATAWYANRNSGCQERYGNTNGTHDQERYDRQKEELYKKYRCGVELKKLEWPVCCFVLCVILPDDTPLCFTEAVQVPGD
jgi:hypothetical protein